MTFRAIVMTTALRRIVVLLCGANLLALSIFLILIGLHAEQSFWLAASFAATLAGAATCVGRKLVALIIPATVLSVTSGLVGQVIEAQGADVSVSSAVLVWLAGSCLWVGNAAIGRWQLLKIAAGEHPNQSQD